MEWIEISITVNMAVIDTMAAIFSEIDSNGYTEEDIEQGNLKKFTLFLDTSKNEMQWCEQVMDLLQSHGVDYEEITCKTVDESTWYESWQQYILPTRMLPDLVICPKWQTYTKDEYAHPHERVMTIDSKLSFGTGDHETTRHCATLLHKYITSRFGSERNVTCLDIGTGTGILLLVAHHLGVENLIGIDLDEDSTIQARENCDMNGVIAHMIHGNLSDDFHGKAHIILANLTVDPLKILLPMIREKLHENGILIISGIVDERYHEIMPYITQYWNILEEVVEGPWHTFALQ